MEGAISIKAVPKIQPQTNSKINFILKIFLIFFIGSIFGFLIEILYGLIIDRVLMFRRGLIYGPFIQVYGVGAVLYYLLICYIKEPKKLFFVGMILGGIVEYVFSFLQEVIFGTISWDYSNMIFNINGRTCLLYCFFWGLIAIIYLKTIFPWIEKLDVFLLDKKVRIITYFLLVFMIFDITISCMAGIRQDERKKRIPPENRLEEFIDMKYPDEFMDKVYINKKEV